MGIYKSVKHGAALKSVIENNGVRKTYNALRRGLGANRVRIKHNKLQVVSVKGWKYVN
jgi:hypothetical protein